MKLSPTASSESIDGEVAGETEVDGEGFLVAEEAVAEGAEVAGAGGAWAGRVEAVVAVGVAVEDGAGFGTERYALAGYRGAACGGLGGRETEYLHKVHAGEVGEVQDVAGGAQVGARGEVGGDEPVQVGGAHCGFALVAAHVHGRGGKGRGVVDEALTHGGMVDGSEDAAVERHGGLFEPAAAHIPAQGVDGLGVELREADVGQPCGGKVFLEYAQGVAVFCGS